MRILSSFICVCLLSSSCYQKDTIVDLKGKWSGYDHDSSYMEFWMNDSLILTWNEKAWSYEVTPFEAGNSSGHFVLQAYDVEIAITSIDSNKMIMENQFGTWTYQRLDSTSPTILYDSEEITSEISERNKKAKGYNRDK